MLLLPPEMELLKTYKALADESRLRIVNLLGTGPLNVQELTALLDLKQSTISHHLKVLSDTKIVTQYKEGTWAYYSLNNSNISSPTKSIIDNFLKIIAQGGLGVFGQHLANDQEALVKTLKNRQLHSHRFFESVAQRWRALRSDTVKDEAFLTNVLKRIPPQAAFADLGCGSGAVLEQLLPRLGVTIGIDYSQAMLNEAAQALIGHKDNIDLRLGSLEHLPLADQSLDVALAYMVLHHLPIPAHAFQDARRVLKPGGLLLIVDLMTHNNDEMRNLYADLWLGFNRSDLEQTAVKAGFCDLGFELLNQENGVFLLTCKR